MKVTVDLDAYINMVAQYEKRIDKLCQELADYDQCFALFRQYKDKEYWKEWSRKDE